MASVKKGRVIEENAVKASEIYRHAFGKKEGRKVSLHFLEAAYLAAEGRIEAVSGREKIGEKELLALAEEKDALAGKKYAVLKDLRESGRAVRLSEKDGLLRVYERGKRFGEAPSLYLVRVIGGRKKISEKDVAAEAEKAHALRKKLVWAFVGKGKPAYYSVEKTRL